MASILETIMLICFGLSWPINLMKSYRARTAKSTSLFFLLLITFGYVAGIAAKFVSGNINYVLIVYFLNVVIVSANIGMYVRNVKLDKKAEKLTA